jgi:hypothetical protein
MTLRLVGRFRWRRGRIVVVVMVVLLLIRRRRRRRRFGRRMRVRRRSRLAGLGRWALRRSRRHRGRPMRRGRRHQLRDLARDPGWLRQLDRGERSRIDRDAEPRRDIDRHLDGQPRRRSSWLTRDRPGRDGDRAGHEATDRDARKGLGRPRRDHAMSRRVLWCSRGRSGVVDGASHPPEQARHGHRKTVADSHISLRRVVTTA